MTNPTFRDIEQLSAFLDGQLSRVDAARMESRLVSDTDLAAVLGDLRLSRSILRRTPRRRAPRNFTLTPKMAGIRPPLPRVVPALNWASVVAALFFVFTLGSNLLGRMSFGAAAPMMAAEAPAMGGGAEGYGGGYGGGGADPTQEAAILETAGLPTPAPAEATLVAPDITPAPDTDVLPPEDTSTKQPAPINQWYIIWPALAVIMLGLAILLRWNSGRVFRRKSIHK